MKRRSDPSVFLVGSWETLTGKNNVAWSRSGDLNKAAVMYGKKATKYCGSKDFDKLQEAVKFAKAKAITMGAGTTLTIDTSYQRYDGSWIVDKMRLRPLTLADLKGRSYGL